MPGGVGRLGCQLVWSNRLNPRGRPAFCAVANGRSKEATNTTGCRWGLPPASEFSRVLNCPAQVLKGRRAENTPSLQHSYDRTPVGASFRWGPCLVMAALAGSRTDSREDRERGAKLLTVLPPFPPGPSASPPMEARSLRRCAPAAAYPARPGFEISSERPPLVRAPCPVCLLKSSAMGGGATGTRLPLLALQRVTCPCRRILYAEIGEQPQNHQRVATSHDGPD